MKLIFIILSEKLTLFPSTWLIDFDALRLVQVDIYPGIHRSSNYIP